MDYSSQIERLEEILETMERNALPLENTLALYEEGQKIIGECRQFLKQAEEKVKRLNDDGAIEDFEPLEENEGDHDDF